MPFPFDSSAARQRVDRVWALPSTFGAERSAYHAYLHMLVRDRYALVNGLQLLRDELQIGHAPDEEELGVCATDFGLPSVLSTLANTHCGDRIHSGEARHVYEQVVATRFACLGELGGPKLESFTPAGGGTDDAGTLAHVTVAHQLDASLRERLYRGNAQSFYLANIDLQTHVGRVEGDAQSPLPTFGKTREAPWRDPRAACCAIVGTLTHFQPESVVHRRIRAQLGEDNYALLAGPGVTSDEGLDLRFVVAAAIILVRGLEQTLDACTRELDERGVAHVTAALTVNRPSTVDTVITLARGTVFGGEVRAQGFGTDARAYGGKLVTRSGDRRLDLRYGDVTANFPVRTSPYAVRTGALVLPQHVIDI
jgi:hypothetical protein